MKPWLLPLLPLACALAGPASGAESCEPLRAQIEAKIASANVTGFTVSTVDASATVPGQVVGSCELGSKKIVYLREAGPAASPTVRPRSAPMLTECRDGSTPVGGTCKP